MSPQGIPWIFCSLLCVLPAVAGVAAHYAWRLFTNQYPHRHQITWIDEQGRKHVDTEWVMLTRDEKRALKEEAQISDEGME